MPHVSFSSFSILLQYSVDITDCLPLLCGGRAEKNMVTGFFVPGLVRMGFFGWACSSQLTSDDTKTCIHENLYKPEKIFLKNLGLPVKKKYFFFATVSLSVILSCKGYMYCLSCFLSS